VYIENPALDQGEYVAHQMTSTKQADAISFNFSLFKVLSILCVATSHWPFNMALPMWIPTTIGLVIFAFSSGMFTSRIYGVEVDVAAFWRKKIERLAVRYWFLLAFISVILLVEGKTVFHWHSLVHVFGLSGFLNLYGHNLSGLGAGLWFFTLLLLFYVTYPYLARLAAASQGDFVFPLVAIVFFFFLNEHMVLAFSLWLTALGFVLGVFVGLYGTRIPARVSFGLSAVALALLLVNNIVFGYQAANGALLGMACITTNLWLMRAQLPQWKPLRMLAKLENCLLEIFIVHTYLFIHPTGIGAVDFLCSMSLIVVTALILNAIGNRLVKLVFSKPAVKKTAAPSLGSLS
jgi:hypothetical protein